MEKSFFRPLSRRRLLVVFLLVLSGLSGCAYQLEDSGKAVILASSEAYKNFSGEFENTDYFRRHKPKRIAVLPFKDLERKAYSIRMEAEDPAGIVRRGMYNHISSLPFEDVELYHVESRLLNAGLTDSRKVDELIAENPKKLMSILGADAAVTGEVTHFDRIFAGIYSQVAVGCQVRMWDLNTGRLLWRADQVSRAHAGGISVSPIGLAMATVASVWNLRGTELLSQTDELFREIVSTIEAPESQLAARTPPPRIDLFAVTNAEKPFVLGQKAAFRVIGDPGCSAYVDLGDFQSSIPLAPVSAAVKQALRAEVVSAVEQNYAKTGHELTPALLAAVETELDSRQIYEGSYTVEAGQEAYGLTAKAYLVNAAGVQASAIDAARFVDIDSNPPAPVQGLAADPLDGKVRLRWARGPEKDLAGYELWKSDTPLSGYQMAARTETEEAILTDLSNFERFFVRVRALDRAGNAGGFGSPAAAVALPDPELYALPQPGPMLGGVIAEKVLLLADKSPYSVMSDLVVADGGVVFLEPGVELRFSPQTSLKVAAGSLMAFGRSEKPIRLSAGALGAGPGAWGGIRLQSGRRILLRHVHIQGAEIGLHIANSAPTVDAVRVAGCSQAGMLLDSGARPTITCSVFEQNEGQGGLVMQGEGLVPRIRHNVFLHNEPFQVQSYTPLQIDLSENYWGESAPGADRFLGNVILAPALTEAPVPCGAQTPR